MSHLKMRRFRTPLLIAALVLTAGLVYAVLYPSLGIRQNRAEEEFQKAWLLYQDRKYDAAIEKFSQALLINPQFHWARRFLSQAYYFAGEKSEALDELETLLRAMPHDLTLRSRIDWLKGSGGNAEGGANQSEFLRIVPRTQGYRYNRPTFVSPLKGDEMAVLSLGNFEIGSMVSYTAQGEPFDNRHRVSGKLNYPMAFAQNTKEVWITDFKEDKIHRLSQEEQGILSYIFSTKPIGRTGQGDLEFRSPAGICHRDGEFIIADSGNNRLERIDDDGKFIASIVRGGDGTAFETPFGLYCNENSIWVTESGAGRISQLDRYGVLQREFSPEKLTKPRHISWDADGNQFLVADETSGVWRMNTEGEVLGRIEGYTNLDGRFVHFARPYSAQYDSFRNLYVADYGASEVVQFVPTGEKFAELYLNVEKISAAQFPVMGVYVTVSSGPAQEGALPRYLTELTASDFQVFENDAPVGNLDISYLDQFNDVLQAVVLVSRSRQMREFETQTPWVLDHLFTHIREKDGFKVMSHGSDVQSETDFSASRLKLLRGVRDAQAERTAVPSALSTMSVGIYDGLTELLPRQGKRALIYLTDGAADDDTLNPYSKDRLVDYARANHIPIFVLSFEHPKTMETSDAKRALQELAEHTGGRYFRALDIDPQIEAKLRAQKEVRYVLSYKSLARKQIRGQYIDMRVKAKFRTRRGLDLSGYFIP